MSNGLVVERKGFQSTLPRRERPDMAVPEKDFSYFNPRSHEGSDDNGKSRYQYYKISIHAPTKGATDQQIRAIAGIKISIHAPTKGATVGAPVDGWIGPFQSTLPRRERRVQSGDFKAGDLDFNPRSHEGNDSNFIQKSFYILDKINKLTLFHAIFPFFVLLLFS